MTYFPGNSLENLTLISKQPVNGFFEGWKATGKGEIVKVEGWDFVKEKLKVLITPFNSDYVDQTNIKLVEYEFIQIILDCKEQLLSGENTYEIVESAARNIGLIQVKKTDQEIAFLDDTIKNLIKSIFTPNETSIDLAKKTITEFYTENQSEIENFFHTTVNNVNNLFVQYVKEFPLENRLPIESENDYTESSESSHQDIGEDDSPGDSPSDELLDDKTNILASQTALEPAKVEQHLEKSADTDDAPVSTTSSETAFSPDNVSTRDVSTRMGIEEDSTPKQAVGNRRKLRQTDPAKFEILQPGKEYEIALQQAQSVTRQGGELLSTIDSKTLGFIHGDTFLGSSEYEGGNYHDNLALLLPYLKYKVESNPQLVSSADPEKGSLVQLLEDFQQRSTFLSSTRSSDVESIETQAKSLTEEVAQMQPGARLLIDGGWVQAKSKQKIGGHAVLYLVEKSHDGSYSFSIVNTGAGINYHDQLAAENKIKYKSLFSLHKIPPENLNLEFFKALREIKTLTHKAEGPPYHYSAEDIYIRILPSLGGVRDIERENQEEWITAQRSGTCSWKSLLKLLQSETTEYKKFNFDLRKDSLQAYFEKKLNPANHDEIQLLRLATENFSRMATKSFKEGLISSIELKEAELLCSRILKKTSEIETSFQQRTYPLLNNEGSLNPSLPPIPQAVPKINRISNSSATANRIAEFSKTALPPTVEGFNAVAQEVLNICHEHLAAQNPEAAIRTVKDFIKCVPLDAFGTDGYWSSLAADKGKSAELNKSMELLLECFELTTLAIFHLPESMRSVPEYEASLCILLTYNHRLAELISEEQFRLENPFFVSWNTNPFAIINDKKLLERLNDCCMFDRQSKLTALTFEDLSYEDEKCSDPIIRKIIDSPEFREQLSKKFPKYVNSDEKSLLKALFPLIVEHGQHPFPTWYLTIARQSLLFKKIMSTEYVLRDPLDKNFDSRTITIKDPWKLKLMPNKMLENSYLLFSNIKFTCSSFSRYSNRSYQQELFGYMRDHKGEFFYKINFSENALKDAPYQATETKTKGKWSASQMREIANMLSTHELFIPQFISYMKKNPDMFIDQEMQNLLYFAFSNKQMLELSFKEFPLAEEEFKILFSDRINLYVTLKNAKPALFMLFLAECINPYLSSSFNFSISEKMALIAEGVSDDLQSNKKTKSLALAYFITSYYSKKEFLPEESKQLISAYFYIKTYGYDETQIPPHTKQMIKEVIDRCYSSPSLNSPSNHLEIVNNIAQLVLKKTDGRWKGSYPIFMDEQSGFKINLETFAITRGTDLVGALPDQILSNADFNKLFGAKEFVVTIPSPDVYQLSLQSKDKNEEVYRLFFEKKEDKQNLVIEKKINDEWYTHLPASEKIVKALPNALVREKTLWGSSKIGKIQIFEQDEKIAEINISSGRWKVTSTKPSLLNPGKLLELQDVYNDKNENNTFLINFQGKDGVFVWDDERIEFPKANISFQRDKDKKLHFSENKSLILLENQVAPATLPFYRGGLTLEDKNGIRHFLLPRKILSVKEGSISRYTVPEYDEETDNGRYFKLKEEEGRLVGTTPEENLYLVYLHLAHKNYAEARRLLNPIYSGNPKGYSSTEHEVAKWIAGLLKTSGDTSPEADALRLAVDQLFSSNGQILVETNPLKYLSQRGHIKTLLLDEEKEANLRETNTFDSRTYAFESVSPEPINQKKTIVEIADQIYSGETEQLNTKIPFLYVDGEKTLTTYWKEFCKEVTSDDANIRSSAVRKLQMLKMGKNSLKDSLIWIATYASDGQRLQLAERTLRFTDKANQLSIQIKELSNSNKGRAEHAKVELKNHYREMVQFYVDFSNTKTTIPSSKTESLKTHKKTFSFKAQAPLEKEVKNDKVKKSGNFNISDDFSFQFENAIDLLGSSGIVLEEAIGTYVPQAIQLNSPKEIDNIETQEFERIQKSIEAYQEQTALSSHYQIDDTQLQPLANVFRKRSERLSEDNKTREQEILTLLHKKPDDIIEAAKYQLKLIGKRKKELSLEDLTIHFLQNDTSVLHKQNPFLTEEDIVKLTDLLTHYLIQATEIQYLGNIADIAEKALSVTGEAYDTEILNLDASLREKRNYNPLTNRTLLVFEYYREVRLRANQVDLINEMTLSKAKGPLKLISQLIMGSGKSKIILPLLAYLNSTGKHVPLIIVPEMLYETNLEDMRRLSGTHLKQPVHTFIIEKNSNLTIDKLDEIIHTTRKVAKKHSYYLISDSTLQALLLHCKDTLTQIGTYAQADRVPKELYLKLDRFKELLPMLSEFGILDEADMILDCIKEVNFAMGEWISLSSETRTSLQTYLNKIVENKRITEFLQITQESDVAFDEEIYKKEIVPLLIENALDMVSGADKWKKDERELVVQYLSSAPSLEKLPPFILQMDGNQRNHLAVVKELIKTLLPLGPKKNSNQHFGLSHEKSTLASIPYARSDTPSEGSLFSNAFETLIYTTLYYTRNGVAAPQLIHLIEECKKQAICEHTNDQIPLEETKGYKRFAELKLIEDKGLFDIQDQDIDSIAAEFNSSVQNKIHFASELAWLEIGAYDRKISSNAQHLMNFFKSLVGFTGTLWNKNTYSSSIKTNPDLTSDGKTISLLANSEPAVHECNDYDNVYSYLNGYNACIDTGAWFRGYPAHSVALKMLENLPETIQAVVYFNDKDIPVGSKGIAVVVQRGKETQPPQLLSSVTLSEEERFTYYNVTTGADISQHSQAKAVVTVGKTMSFRDLSQGVWRMRGLDKKQKVDFAILKTMAPLITKKVDQHTGGVSPAAAAALRICEQGIHIQAARQREDSLRSIQQKIFYIIEKTILSEIDNPNISQEEAFNLCHAITPILSPLQTLDPFTLFGNISQEIPIKDYVDAIINAALEKMKAAYIDYPNLEAYCNQKTLETKIREAVDFNLLPPTAISSNSQSIGSETQTKQQTNTEQQLQTQLQLEVVEESYNFSKFPRKALPIAFGNIFSDDYWTNIGIVTRPADTLLSKRKDELQNYDSSKPFFSKEFRLTNDVAPGKRLANDLRYKLFQKGTMPVTTCALQVSPDQDPSMRLIVLSPNEVIFFNKIIQIREFIEKPEIGNEIKEAIRKKLVEKGYSKEDIVQEIDKYEKDQKRAINLEFSDWKEIMLSITKHIPEMHTFINKISSYQFTDTLFDKKECELILVDPLIKGGAVKGREDILNDPKFIELSTQAKIYNGVVDIFTEQEKAYLKKWVEEQGGQRFLDMLTNIIGSRHETIERFKNSYLAQLIANTA